MIGSIHMNDWTIGLVLLGLFLGFGRAAYHALTLESRRNHFREMAALRRRVREFDRAWKMVVR